VDVDTFIFLLCALFLIVGIVLIVRHFLKKPHPAGPPVADEEKAFQIVWFETFKRSDPPPVVAWIESTFLTCGNGQGWDYVAPDGTKTCVAGLSYLDTKTSQVAWPKPVIPISTSAFAHELCHHYLDRIGQPDANHTGPGFAAGGIKDQAVAALKAAGL
jgi:hypothetical protein